MPKNTKEIENLKENLAYLGLNLSRVPKALKEYEPINFRVSKSYDETHYKVYRHIPISDIEILLTKANRLADLKQKYKSARTN